MLKLGRNVNFRAEGSPSSHIKNVFLSEAARKQGTYVIGTTGTGKTTFLLNLILQDIYRQGPQGYEGVCVLDPHGDFISDILCRIPDERIDDVIVFDPADTSHPIAFNLLALQDKDNAHERDLVVDTIIDTLFKLYESSWGPRMEDLLRNSIHTLLLHPTPTTLIDLRLILTSESHRLRLTEKAKLVDPILNSYWTEEFPEGGSFQARKERAELVSSSLNKIGRFLVNPLIRNIVGQEASGFSFREVMDSGKILLVNLSKGGLGQDNSRFLGALLVNQILIAALSRRDKPFEERRPFHLYVDEYQNFATETFPQLQSEARKYGIDTLVSHQYRDQLDDENKGSTLNVANVVVLRVSGKDGIELATQFDVSPTYAEPQFRPLYDPVDDQETIFIRRKVEGSEEAIYELLSGATQAFSDAHLETANHLAQQGNYEATCRILWTDDEDGEKPRTFKQFQLALEPPPDPVDDCFEREALIRERNQRRYAPKSRREVEEEIAMRIDSLSI